MTGLIEQAGKRWGMIAAILGAIPKAARVTAARIRDWVRRGLLTAHHAGRNVIVALEDVLAVERSTRQTAAQRGGAKRGTKTAAIA
jgi:hypothetical protein